MGRAFPFPRPVRGLTYAPRRLRILSPIEDGLWYSFSALFRADPCLRFLKELKQVLRQKVQRMTVREPLYTED